MIYFDNAATSGHKPQSVINAVNVSLKNLSALDVLPYHTMGVNKYKELGIPYKLEGVPALPLSEAVKAKQYILQGIREVKNR